MSERGKVLIVEDDDDSRRGLQLALGASGYAVYESHNVGSAIAAIRAHKPDIILLDLGMSDGLHGRRLLTWLGSRQDCSPLPVIVISGASSTHSIDEALAAGARRYFVKPVSLPKLLDAIEQLVPRRGVTPDALDRRRAGELVGR
ncbi:MAG: response regulator [Planctomycetes bacterium]|nr:response regulator [Planctomycetota bacterium]